jgi:preprotein translocase subunit YajC
MKIVISSILCLFIIAGLIYFRVKKSKKKRFRSNDKMATGHLCPS